MSKLNQTPPAYSTPAVETPYMRAKQQWDNRLGSLAMTASQWRLIALINFLIIFVLLAVVWVSLIRYKPQLYIAEVEQTGHVQNVKILAREYHPSQAQIEYFLAQFVKSLRNLPLDPVVAKANWVTTYDFVNQRGATVLTQYFQKNNPSADLGKKTITTKINNINPLSDNSYEIDWQEEVVDGTGHVVSKQVMSGLFTFALKTPTTKEVMLKNPLGIYIVDFHISPKINVR